MITPPFSAEDVREIRRSLAEDPDVGSLPCPVCGALMLTRAVEPRPDVPYVRRRIRVVCPDCGRSGAIDRRAGPSG